MNENQALIEKTIVTGDMAFGGQLNPAQQEAFVTLVRDTSVLLSRVRFENMPQSVKLIDKLYVGQPVTRGAVENVEGSSYAAGQVAFDQLRLEAHKLKSDWAISTETLQENIEGAAFEDRIMTMMGKRISTDLELLAIQGIEGGTFAGPLASLLNQLDGWDKLSDSANVVDAGGATLATLGADIFERAINLMPENYLQDPDLVWLMSRPIATNWQTHIAKRETAAGDDALRGNTIRPFGFPVLIVPGIPSRKAITVSSAKAAQVTSSEFGPYTIVTGTNDGLSFNVNGIGVITPTLAAGVYTAVEMVAEIKRALIAAGGGGPATAAALRGYDNGQGQMILETVGVGAAYSIVVGAATANAELGLAAATYSGANVGSNTVNEGSFILLCNLKNLIFGMVDETRVYSEFNKDRDRLETVTYNQVAVEIENLEAIVKIANLRRAG